jgi:hypothetical protein
MNTTTSDFESGIYYDSDAADARIRRLRDLGYSDDQISVMMRDKEQAQAFVAKSGGHAAEGAVTGGAIGGGIGAIVAGLVATGSVTAIVGTGGVALPLVVGPLAAALAGLGAGAAAGGVVGALVGAGIPKDKAIVYDEGLSRGGIVLGVQTRPDNRDEVRRVFAD